MNSIHSPKLSDDDKNMYIFPKSIVTNELIKVLESQYEVRGDSFDYSKTNIKLVPTPKYFICCKPYTSWVCKQKINITKEQVDKFLTLNSILPITFLDFMELELTQ